MFCCGGAKVSKHPRLLRSLLLLLLLPSLFLLRPLQLLSLQQQQLLCSATTTTTIPFSVEVSKHPRLLTRTHCFSSGGRRSCRWWRRLTACTWSPGKCGVCFRQILKARFPFRVELKMLVRYIIDRQWLMDWLDFANQDGPVSRTSHVTRHTSHVTRHTTNVQHNVAFLNACTLSLCFIFVFFLNFSNLIRPASAAGADYELWYTVHMQPSPPCIICLV
jgi:hypothetical protein